MQFKADQLKKQSRKHERGKAPKKITTEEHKISQIYIIQYIFRENQW